jgi:arsenite methyltransferase
MDNIQIYDRVREHYGAAAQSGGTAYGQKVAKSFGYSEEELHSIPSNANLGLSCGNPLVIAKLNEVGPTQVAFLHGL